MTEKSFGVALREKMVALRVFRPQGVFLGCSPEELEEIRLGQQVDFLPRIYREFMLEMGKGAGGFLFNDGIYTCPSAAENKAFVFFVSSNDIFYYFETDPQVDDPPVYQFDNRYAKLIKANETLSNFLDAYVNMLNEVLHSKIT